MNLTDRNIPEAPLSFIRECLRDHRVLWTYHVNMRMTGRFLKRETILEAVDSYEIIESYPDD